MKTFIFYILIFCGLAFVFHDKALANKIEPEAFEPKGKSNSEEDSVLFEFLNFTKDSEWKSIPKQDAGSHFLGDNVARKLFLLEKTYTYQTAIGPGNPGMKKLIQKPMIYNSCQKAEKYFKKALKNDEMSENEATQLFDHILMVSLAAFSQNTAAFETALKESKEATEIIQVFKRTSLVGL